MINKCDHIVCVANGYLVSSHDFIRGNYDGWCDAFDYCPRCGAKIDWDAIATSIDVHKRLREKRALKINRIPEIIGKWPGDESDAEFDELMREHEERD